MSEVSLNTPIAGNPDAMEVAPGIQHEKLEGWIPPLATDEEVRIALEKAFDYRGDITITRKDGTTVEGYLFDRRSGSTLRSLWFVSFLKIRTRRSPSRIPTLPLLRSLDATPPQEKAGKPG